jgi:2-C-methyl-D-erythritol 2,4-cyclodiphosphate synthase
MTQQPQFRIGQGLDVHAFTAGDPSNKHVMLAGVRIAHERGLAAHSDGDVALHALCDALLGAAALGDIGKHFPPGDEKWRGASGVVLVHEVMRLIRQEGWSVVNVDITIACEAPRIAPHVADMRKATAAALQVDVGSVSVKATTTERLGFCGRGEGIAALAVALLTRD